MEIRVNKDPRLHARINGGYFERYISWKGVRWSDKAFTFNVECLNYFDKECVAFIRFNVEGKYVFTIPLDLAKQFWSEKVNERGEKDIRIPMKYFEKTSLLVEKVDKRTKTEKRFERRHPNQLKLFTI